MQEIFALTANLARALETLAGALHQAAQSLSPGSPLQVSPGMTLRAGAPADLVFPQDLTVVEAIKEFLLCKARAGRSDRYLAALRVSLKSFAKGRGAKPLATVTANEIEHWLRSQEWSPRTQENALSDLGILYNWMKRRNLVASNPTLAVEPPVPPAVPPRIHSVDQVKKVLELARGRPEHKAILRALAVRYFAGLRSSEVARLEEKEINLKEGWIEVTAAKAKTRRRRLVTIQPNLAAWLRCKGGRFPLHDVNNRMRWFSAALKKAHGFEWEHNVTRHSFVSYHLAHFGNAGKTALEAGHTEQMTFSNYRALVTPAAAQEFWQIFPTGKKAKPPGG